MTPSFTRDNIIVGLGATGLSVAAFLLKQQQDFAVVDNCAQEEQVKKLQAIKPDVELRVGEFEADFLSTAKRLIVNPGIAIASDAIAQAAKNSVEVIGDIELFAKAIPKQAKLAALTGSNGKSTCVTMLYAMAQEAGVSVKLGGNIGTPALDLLGDDSTELYILELSSYQLETTESLKCNVACVLNLSPDHLDRYESYHAYTEAKKKLTKQTAQLVLGTDDVLINKWDFPAINFSLSPVKNNTDFGVAKFEGQPWIFKGQAPLMATGKLALAGSHNVSNALAALAMGDILGLPMDAMCQALTKLTGLAHRTQLAGIINGATWINDSKGTNVGATVAAINGLSGQKNIILLAGGQTKAADLSPLLDVVALNVKQVLLFGEDAQLLFDTLRESVPCQLVADLTAACESAKAMSQKGDVVLLSPAGASFDSYKNFAERGFAFMDWIKSAEEAK